MSVTRSRLWLLGIGLALVSAVLVGRDIVEDVALHMPAFHVIEDLVLAAVWLGGVGLFAVNIESLRRSSLRLSQDLSATRTDLETFRRGLGDEIERQLEAWSLTPSEKQVAQLLLKGLGHREIAEIRDTSEKTVRQQAARVYQKAQVAGRAELSAFFLEDFLAPTGAERPSLGSAETSA